MQAFEPLQLTLAKASLSLRLIFRFSFNFSSSARARSSSCFFCSVSLISGSGICSELVGVGTASSLTAKHITDSKCQVFGISESKTAKDQRPAALCESFKALNNYHFTSVSALLLTHRSCSVLVKCKICHIPQSEDVFFGCFF